MSVIPDPAKTATDAQADPAKEADGLRPAEVREEDASAPAEASRPDARQPRAKDDARARRRDAEGANAPFSQSFGDRPARQARIASIPATRQGKDQPLTPRRLDRAEDDDPPAKRGRRALAAKAGRRLQESLPPPPPPIPVRPAVSAAKPQKRHWLLLASFIALVIVPTILWAAYLWTRATDQYVSTLAFSVRQEDSQPSMDLLGGLAAFGGMSSGASDTDILYQYILSPDMVENVDKRLNLSAAFSREWPNDFIFAYNPDGSIEDLTDYWERQVKVYYDSSTGLITLNVSAFTPEGAQQIAQAILEESTDKINELSSVAREDSMRLSRSELEKARTELTEARQNMTSFRMRTQIVDPQADLAGQMGVLTQLQSQLAEQLLQLDMLMENAQPSDNRVLQAQQKEAALRKLIASERDKFGREGHGPAGESYAQLVAEYEKLAVDREFAEGAYRSARANYELALVDAQRQSRYLAAHITPRIPQSSTEPRRLQLLAMVAGLLLIAWSIMSLIYYSVRDRG